MRFNVSPFKEWVELFDQHLKRILYRAMTGNQKWKHLTFKIWLSRK